jgi:hypothetical protein
MTLIWPPLNLWAVLVAGAATFFLGGLWYSALFGKTWIRLYGYTPEQLQAMKLARPPVVFFTVMILAYLLMATLMGFLIQWTGARTWLDGAAVGLVVWGMALAVALTDYITSAKKPGIYYIDCSYQLVYLVLTGIILTVWQNHT